jgi:hypothetical protein
MALGFLSRETFSLQLDEHAHLSRKITGFWRCGFGVSRYSKRDKKNFDLAVLGVQVPAILIDFYQRPPETLRKFQTICQKSSPNILTYFLFSL